MQEENDLTTAKWFAQHSRRVVPGSTEYRQQIMTSINFKTGLEFHVLLVIFLIMFLN